MGMEGGVHPRDAPVGASEVAEGINPSSRSRRLTIATYLALFLLGLPYWWYTTSIERLPLPVVVSRLHALR